MSVSLWLLLGHLLLILPFHTVHGVLKARILKWFPSDFKLSICYVSCAGNLMNFRINGLLILKNLNIFQPFAFQVCFFCSFHYLLTFGNPNYKHIIPPEVVPHHELSAYSCLVFFSVSPRIISIATSSKSLIFSLAVSNMLLISPNTFFIPGDFNV